MAGGFRHLLDLAIIVLPFLRPRRLLRLAAVIEVLAILEIERYQVGTKIHTLAMRCGGP